MLTRIFVMTLRYDSISEAKSAYQAACPTRLMERLAMEPLCVRHECYASPLNRFHANFCSMYPDVDRFFGSKGNFYDYDQFTDGCYEANPPFDGMSVGSCFYRLRAVLAAASTPLTFVMVLPDMDLTSSRPDRQTYLQQGFSSASAFLSAKRAVEATAHVYRMGLQHKLTSQVNGMTEHHWRPEQRSWIYFFQNEAGRARWPITEELQDELAREFDY
jgi:phosphorylated CTD-interacting factor 1